MEQELSILIAHSRFLWGLCCLIFSFLCSVLQIIVPRFVFMLLLRYYIVKPSSIYGFCLPIWYLQPFLWVETKHNDTRLAFCRTLPRVTDHNLSILKINNYGLNINRTWILILKILVPMIQQSDNICVAVMHSGKKG